MKYLNTFEDLMPSISNDTVSPFVGNAKKVFDKLPKAYKDMIIDAHDYPRFIKVAKDISHSDQKDNFFTKISKTNHRDYHNLINEMAAWIYFSRVQIVSEGYHLNRKSYVVCDKSEYAKSTFGQKKFKLYILTDDKFYYIGDIRRFSSNNKALSYLTLDNVKEIDANISEVRYLDSDEREIVESELNKNCLSSNLMDEDITYRQKIEKDLNIIITL